MSSNERISAVAVYCASSDAIHDAYREAAQNLGKSIASSNRSLIYGGGGIGLMGVVADAVAENGGRVHGIITETLVNLEQARHNCDELEVVPTMRERKRRMEELADAFIALPGGIGTYEELLEIIVGKLLAEHAGPIVLVDVKGYFQPLIALLDHTIKEGFMNAGVRELFQVVQTPDQAITILNDHEKNNQNGKNQPPTSIPDWKLIPSKIINK